MRALLLVAVTVQLLGADASVHAAAKRRSSAVSGFKFLTKAVIAARGGAYGLADGAGDASATLQLAAIGVPEGKLKKRLLLSSDVLAAGQSFGDAVNAVSTGNHVGALALGGMSAFYAAAAAKEQFDLKAPRLPRPILRSLMARAQTTHGEELKNLQHDKRDFAERIVALSPEKRSEPQAQWGELSRHVQQAKVGVPGKTAYHLWHARSLAAALRQLPPTVEK